MKTLSSLLLLGSLLISCGKQNAPTVPNPQRPLDEKNVLIGAVNDPLQPHGIQIKIAKNSFGHKFLMTAAQITGKPTPTGRAQASKVVYFERKAANVFLFESTLGKLSTDSVATKILLTEFPITSESQDFITFDFKQGMNLLFFQSAYHASDDPKPTPTHFPVIKTLKSFISNVELRGKYLFINQYNRIEIPAKDGLQNYNLQIKYTFSSYKKNAQFIPKKSNEQKVVGFFEVHPTIKAGSGISSTHIMKFDSKKPIVFSLSNNIPKEYIQAVKDGILYWNKVFAKKMMQVEMLPKNITVHEPGYNIVQWLHWDTAGFAYANMQADPMTGENLQSHIYMTSVFGKGGLKRAKLALKKYLANKSKQTENEFVLGIKGFHNPSVCQYTGAQHPLLALQKIIDNTANIPPQEAEKIYLRFAQDYIRSVTAHEIGHTLGLRHNFAGSTSTTITPELLPAVQKTYFLTGELLSEMTPGSTVMDYTPPMGSAMIGAHIRQGGAALEYDKQAITWGYSQARAEDMQFPRFCTDTHRAKGIYHDCKVWDFLENPFQAAFTKWQETLSDLPFNIVMKYGFLDKNDTNDTDEADSATTAPPLDEAARLKKIKGIILTPEKDAKELLKTGLLPLIEMLGKKAEFITIKKDFPIISSFNQKEYADKILLLQKNSIAELGGISDTIFTPFILDSEFNMPIILEIKKTFAKNLENLLGALASENELTIIRSQFAKYLPIFKLALLKEFATLLKDKNFNVIDQTLAKTITTLSKAILMAKSDVILAQQKSPSVENNEVAPLVFYKPKFAAQYRTPFAELLAHNFYPHRPSFNRMGKKEVYNLHLSELKTIIGERNDDDLSDELFNWKIEETSIFSKIIKK